MLSLRTQMFQRVGGGLHCTITVEFHDCRGSSHGHDTHHICAFVALKGVVRRPPKAMILKYTQVLNLATAKKMLWMKSNVGLYIEVVTK